MAGFFLVGVKGLKPSTSRSQTERAINCATPRSVDFGNYTSVGKVFLVVALPIHAGSRYDGWSSFMKNILKKKIAFLRSHPRLDILLLLVGLGIFVAITTFNIARDSIWFDEAFGFYITQFDFLQIAQFTGVDVHPPLYYWLLGVWEALWGTSEAALRSLSILFGTIAIAITYALSRKMFGRLVGAVTLVFLVISPMLIRYSDEARMYTLAAVFVMGATYLLLKATESGKRRHWVFYGILVGLGMWTHYFTALAWLTHWAWRAISLRRGSTKGRVLLKKFFSKDWIIAHIVAVGLFLPWLPFMVAQLTGLQGGGFWISAVSFDSLTNYLSNVIFYLNHDQMTTWLGLALLVVVVGLAVLAVRTYRSLSRADKTKYLLFAMMTVLPVLILFVASLPPLRSSFVERYLIPAAMSFAVFAAVTIVVGSRKWPRLPRVLAVLLLSGMMVYGVTNVYFYGNYNKNSDTHIMTRELIQEIARQSEPGVPIIANSPWIFYEASYYATPEHPVFFIDKNTPYIYGSVEMLKQSDMHKIKDLEAFEKANPKVWYIGVTDEDLKSPEEGWTQIKTAAMTSPVNGRVQYRGTEFNTN